MKWCFLLAIVFTPMGCSSSTVAVDIDIPINQPNPFTELTNDGVLIFQFDALLPNFSSLNDLDTTISPVQFPDPPFVQANKESFDLAGLELDGDRAYRVTVFGSTDPQLPPENAKYRGVASCPLTPSLGADNTISVCLGLNGTTPGPICTDTLPFADCPGT